MVKPMSIASDSIPCAPSGSRAASPAALGGACLVAGVLIGLLAGGAPRPAPVPWEYAIQAPRAVSPRILPGPVAVTPLRVIDGDTFEARAPVWFGQEITVLVRVRGVDAPETNGKCVREVAMARDATATLGEILGGGRVVLTELAPDKYNGRVVASAWVETGHGRDSVGDMLVAGGYARPYDGRARARWCA